MTEQTVCRGCGAAFQSDQQEAPGFLPNSAREKGQALCRRCFRIRNYGEFTRVAVTSEDYRQEVSKILDEPGLVLYVLDVFDLVGSLVTGLSRYVLGSRVIVAVNKVDLLPDEVDVSAMEDWIRDTVEQTGVQVADVAFISAASGYGVDNLISTVKRRVNGPIYVVGMANVGKSTLLNRLLQHFGVKDAFTVSRVPGTTLGMTAIEVPVLGVTRHEAGYEGRGIDSGTGMVMHPGEHGVDDGKTLRFVDTPGLLHGSRVVDVLCAECLKVAVPQKRLRPRVFQLNPGQSLWLGGFARFDFIDGIRQSVVCYVSNDLPVHRTKLERAEHIGAAHGDDILRVPCVECRQQLSDLLSYDVAAGRFKHGVKQSSYTFLLPKLGADLVIPGLGWITVFGAHLQGKVLAPRGIEVTTRRRLIGDVSRA